MTRSFLWKSSVALLIFNILLGGVAFFSHWQNDSQLALAKNVQNKDQSVLGASTNIPLFNPNYVLSNQTFSSTRVFGSEQNVQSYLESSNSPLKNYSTQGHRASYWIFAAARGQTSSKYGVVPSLNPGLILSFLEKEQSLVSLANYDINGDPDSRLKIAMGYGCPDDKQCDSTYYGFVNQVNWAAYQLQLNYNQARTGGGTPYQINSTITTLDEYNVFLTNEATAAVYRYTPHVFWGNYNLWKIIVSNGWGVDSTTYNASQIDTLNLAGKDKNINLPNQPKINASDVLDILKTDYNLGDSSDQIKRLQQFLRQEGYYLNREITGLYGTVTDNALQNYRRDKGISGGVKAVTQDQCTSLIQQQWQNGQTDDSVKSLQQCLRDMGLFDWPSNTGFFGPVTQQSLDKARNKTGSTETNPNCSSLKTQSYTFGETSERVRQLQACMRIDKVFNWPTDTGYFGPVTQTAWDSWKSSGSGSTTDSSNASSSSCDSLKNQTFTYGQTTDQIKQLQGCLRLAGLFNWPTDTGYFGPVTQEAYSKWKNRDVPQFDCGDLKGQEWEYGETSDRVRQLQACMRSAGKFNWPSDTGYFGDVTKASMVDWRGYF